VENHCAGCHGVYQKIFAACSSKRIYENQAFGFLNPNSALSIEKVRELISFIHDFIALFVEIPEPEMPGIKCCHCGHDLKFIFFVQPEPQGRPG
jgi:hypothetical protein